MQRQPNDRGIGAGKKIDKPRRPPLNGITARLAPPFAGLEISGNLALIQTRKPDDRGDGARYRAAVRRADRDRREHAMAAPRKQKQATLRLGQNLRLRQNPRPGGNHRVGSDHKSVSPNGRKFFSSQALRIKPRFFTRVRRFIDVGGQNFRGLDADLAEQSQTARAGGGEDEPGYLKRNVMRPLVRS